MKHLILFDEPCLLCHKAVHAIAKRDRQGLFAFAPLSGETAKRYPLLEIDSVVLIENFEGDFQIYYEGKAVRRIARHLGRPLYLPNWLYRLIAKRRMKLCKRAPDISHIKLLP